LLGLFGEEINAMVCPEYCCDAFDMSAMIQGDRKSEMALLIQATGAVKVTEWMR